MKKQQPPMGKKVRIDQDAAFEEITAPKACKFKARNEKQKQLSQIIRDNEITIHSGPAGCGKSYVSLAIALELVLDKSTPYRKLAICTPAVEADEKLGFLPGTDKEKLEPFIASSVALVDKIIGKNSRERLTTMGTIEVKVLAHMRGANIDDTILVCEEAQNMTPKQMKTLLTRIGENSKFIISGDLEQSDRYKHGKDSGLSDSLTRLRGIDGIGYFEFDNNDIVRNPIISKILDRYQDLESKIIKPKPQLITENTEAKAVTSEIPGEIDEETEKVGFFKKIFS